MKVWIDIDGVVANFQKRFFSIANGMWPGVVPRNYVPSDYDFSDILTAKQSDEIWAWIKTIPNFWLRCEPYNLDAIALRSWLPRTQHEIFFITSRKSTGGVGSRPQTILWLYEQCLYPLDKPPTVIAVASSKEKKKYIEEFRIDYGVDDLPATVNDLNMLPWHHCYLMNRPYNQLSNQARVHSLQEFLDIVDSAARSQDT